MTIETTTQPRDRGSLILGSILSVPLFLVAFLVVATITYLVWTFLQGTADGVARIVELVATVISSVAGVAAGRWLCDKALKSWSGWPSFILLIILTLMTITAIVFGYSEVGGWQMALQIIQIVSATIAGWFILIKGETLG